MRRRARTSSWQRLPDPLLSQILQLLLAHETDRIKAWMRFTLVCRCAFCSCFPMSLRHCHRVATDYTVACPVLASHASYCHCGSHRDRDSSAAPTGMCAFYHMPRY